MKIREADLDKDALAIMEGARDFAKRSGIQGLFPEDDSDFVEAIGRIVSLESVVVLVAEHDEKVVAGIGLLFAPMLWNPKKTTADELFWWASKEAPYRAAHYLFDYAMTYIDMNGAEPNFKSLQTSPKGVDRLYRKRGLHPVETSYMRTQ